MKLLCVDIGNTHAHFCVFSGPDVCDVRAVSSGKVETVRMEDRGSSLYSAMEDCGKQPGEWGISFCSVVPDGTSRLRALIRKLGVSAPVFQLNHTNLPGVRLHYPCPEEIGQDRLANVVAASLLYRLPCVVIDLGTAVTFDVISSHGGYEGGVIAPGIAIMTHYLHEKTALLPELGHDITVNAAIGKSTVEAMGIGCVIGFRGMIEALLAAVKDDLEKQGEKNPTVLITGGTSELLFHRTNEEERGHMNRIAGSMPICIPDLTLKGLALAFQHHNDSDLL